MSVVRYAYLQARLQARYGDLPDERLWSRLEAIGNAAHFLSTLRATPLRPWLSNIGPRSNVHHAEQAIRRLFRDEVAQVARWYPEAWRPAVLWVARLIDLPALQGLLTRPLIPQWVREDPLLRPFAIDVMALRNQALSDSVWAPLLDAQSNGIPLATAWTERWRALWPEGISATDRAALETLIRRFSDHDEQLRGTALADSRLARTRLTGELRRLFRRHPQRPVTGFVYLGLAGLAAERLRGNLVRLLLFGEETAA